MEAQPNNFSYEKLSVSYDVVRPVVALVAMPKSLLAPEKRNNPSKPNQPRRRQSEQPGLLSYTKNAIKVPFSMQFSAQFLAPTMLCRYENPLRLTRTTRIIRTTLATKKSALARILFGLFSPSPSASSPIPPPTTGRHIFVAGPATALAELADISATKHASPATRNLPLAPTPPPSSP